jgi:DAK2 domain fusion protein YloV
MSIISIDGYQLKTCIISGANNLINHKHEVDDLNVFPVPDGDTGTNMSMTVGAASSELASKDDASISAIADYVASASLRGARGNSGVILSQLFRGFYKGLEGADTADVPTLAKALINSKNVAYKAVMKPTEGTILTVARESAEYALEISDSVTDVIEFTEKVIARAKKSLDNTPNILPVLKQAGVVDAGGMGIVVILEGILAALKGEPVELKNQSDIPAKKTTVKKTEIDTANIKFMYCTEFLINKKSLNASVLAFREAISPKGDCMLVIEDDDIVKVHIHTNHPGFVLEQAVKIGELTNLKIDNMKYQHNETIAEEYYESDEAEPTKDFGIVSVSSGEGMNQIMTDLGVDAVVMGGQSMNPSTEDILAAVKTVPASTVYVLPNNKNIIMAAEQVDELTDKNVIVIPSKTVPQGITAILSFDPSASAEDNKEAMVDALSTVKTGSVTFAARDSEFDGFNINQGDIMAMEEGKITNVGGTPNEAVMLLLDNMVDSSSSIISIYYGEDITAEQAGEIEKQVSEKYDDCDIMINEGGQPLYYYIISVE